MREKRKEKEEREGEAWIKRDNGSDVGLRQKHYMGKMSEAFFVMVMVLSPGTQRLGQWEAFLS